jgi:hypothetical protein
MRKFLGLLMLLPVAAILVLSCDEPPTAPKDSAIEEAAAEPLFKAGQQKALGYTLQWATLEKSGGQWIKGSQSHGVTAVHHVNATTFWVEWESFDGLGPCAVTISVGQLSDGTSGYATGWQTLYGPNPPWYEVWSRNLETGAKTGVWPTRLVRHCTTF